MYAHTLLTKNNEKIEANFVFMQVLAITELKIHRLISIFNHFSILARVNSSEFPLFSPPSEFKWERRRQK
jgi:hypothetical protein